MLFGINVMKTKIKIAIIDSGFDEAYCITRNRIIKKFGIKDNIISSDIQDEHGHGTGVTKIIDDIVEDIEFVIIKILDKNCQGNDEQLITALKLALLEKVDIINISLGTTNKHASADINKLCTIAYEKDIVIVTTCPNDNLEASWPYNNEFVIKVRANSSITDNNVYYDKNNVFWCKGAHHIIPWLNGNYIYSGSNSFSTPYIVEKIVNILKQNSKRDLLLELKKKSYNYEELNYLVVKKENCISPQLLKDIQEIVSFLLKRDIAFTRLTLQGMTPELTIELLKMIEDKLGLKIRYSLFNYIDFEYIENITNRIYANLGNGEIRNSVEVDNF